MDFPVGLRFNPTDEEIVDYYLRRKNLDSNTTYVDGIINTIDIYGFDPWNLHYKSMMKSTDLSWCFFGVRNKRGGRQNRRTNSGSWKKTGETMNIMSKNEKIGEKRFFVFQFSDTLGGGSKWVMHEYTATFLSPHQMITYTLCKVMFKGEEREFSSSYGIKIENNNPSYGIKIENNNPFMNTVNEKENPCLISEFLTEQEETQLEHITNFNNIFSDFKSLIDHTEHNKIVPMQEIENGNSLMNYYGGGSMSREIENPHRLISEFLTEQEETQLEDVRRRDDYNINLYADNELESLFNAIELSSIVPMQED